MARRTTGRKASIASMARYHNLVLVHLPKHASWLNQVEIYFSVVQRKVLTPNDFATLDDVAERLLTFQERYEELAEPFQWKFTRADLRKLRRRISEQSECLGLAA